MGRSPGTGARTPERQLQGWVRCLTYSVADKAGLQHGVLIEAKLQGRVVFRANFLSMAPSRYMNGVERPCVPESHSETPRGNIG